jgi:protein transport protein SEC24
MSTDTRVYYMRMLSGMSVGDSIGLMYPRMFGIHDLDLNGDEGTFVEELGRVVFPGFVRASYERLDVDGVYLFENGLVLYLWVGREVVPQLIVDLFGVESQEAIDVTQVCFWINPSIPCL